MSNEVSKEVSVIDSESVISVSEKFSGGMINSSIYTAYDRNTLEGRVKLLEALSDCPSIRDNVGKVIDIKAFTVHEVEYADEDGVVSVGRRTVIDTDKGLMSAMSGGIEKALMNIIAVFGPVESWEAPVRVKIVELKSRRGFRFLSLRPEV